METHDNQAPDAPAAIPLYRPPTEVSTLPHHVRVQNAQKTLAEFTKHIHLGPKRFAEWEREAEAELEAAQDAAREIDKPAADAARERRFEADEKKELARLLSLQAKEKEWSQRGNASRKGKRLPVDPAKKAEENRKYREKQAALRKAAE